MLPEDLRRKLEELNRGPLRYDAARPRPERKGPSLGGTPVETPLGSCLRLERTLSEVAADSADFLARYRYAFALGAGCASGELAEVLAVDPTRVTYIDLETAGLTSASCVFLVGLMRYDGRDLRITQYLARDYAEEAPMLAAVMDALGGAEAVISFNGKSFDLPYLLDRSAVHGVPARVPRMHVDLLHVARREWREALPNCRLQTLEYYICGRSRYADVPSAQVPEYYHNFVATGDAAYLADILRHNVLDLVTMAEIALFLALGFAPGE